MTRSFLKPLLLMCCVLATVSISGCTQEGTGHVEDKTPGGTPTPPAATLMDAAAMDNYAKEQAEKAAAGTTAGGAAPSEAPPAGTPPTTP